MLIPLSLIDIAAEGFTEDVAALRTRIAQATALELDGLERLDLRRASIEASAIDGPPMAWMRYIGRNDLVGTNWLSIASTRARAVGRLLYRDRATGRTIFATGFMVSSELMMTNHHVVRATDAEGFHAVGADAILEFDHELDTAGRLKPTVRFRLDPVAFFFACQALDFALVAVEARSVEGDRDIVEFGSLVLNGSEGAVGTGDFANIVQHVGGEPKSIAVRENQILKADHENHLYYVSDTATGSSGAPVFNDDWQVIAVHSAGVARQDASGRYVDRDGLPIQPVGGHIDESRAVWTCNLGFNASAIVSFLASAASGVAAHPLVKAVLEKAATPLVLEDATFEIPDVDEAMDFAALRLTPFSLQGLGVTFESLGTEAAISTPPAAVLRGAAGTQDRCAQLQALFSVTWATRIRSWAFAYPCPCRGRSCLKARQSPGAPTSPAPSCSTICITARSITVRARYRSSVRSTSMACCGSGTVQPMRPGRRSPASAGCATAGSRCNTS